jgi:predicted secreted protein
MIGNPARRVTRDRRLRLSLKMMLNHRQLSGHSAMLAALAAGLLLACGSTAPQAATSPSPGTGSTPVTTVASPAADTVVATDADNGKTISLKVGQRLLVRLNSTYWTYRGSSNLAVLQPSGQPVVSPSPQGCVAGQGCGTASAAFTAIGPGTADVTASRTSCGEAMGCTGDQGSYRLTVVVKNIA